MKKVLILGSPGSGKSTFARRLQEKTDLPLCHLDLLYWNPDKTTVDSETFRTRLEAVLHQDRWILDGNFSSTMEWRLRFCDTVFLFDLPVDTCLQGIKARRNRPRPDLPWIETEEDGEFTAFVKAFPQERLPRIYALLKQFPHLALTVFHSREQSEEYLERM